jgi:porphobilinogen synthase
VTFPARRLRRLRRTPAMRRLVAETRIGVDDFVAPLFVREGIDTPQPIASLPGHFQHTRDSLRKEARELVELGIPAVILFGIPKHKDSHGSEAWNPDGITQVVLRDLRDEVGDRLVLMADLCLDEYTDHGHCGVLDGNGQPDNDATLELYARIGVAQAAAGADVVAPSGMMDGQVAATRSALDDAGHSSTAILAYAAKYASAHYGPFRDAVGVSITSGGDRKGYQQDIRNVRDALLEVAEDVDEGADIVMVKPALAYLDVIAAVRAITRLPVAAYNVSGEYAMVKAAAERGWIDGHEVAVEHVTAIKRAGADIVLTYFARELAETLHG